MPEVESQGYLTILDDVYKTGKTFVGRSLSVDFYEKPEADPVKRFVDIALQPIVDAEGRINEIFAVGSDVTDHHITQLKLKELNAQLADKVSKLNDADRRKDECSWRCWPTS